MTEESREKEKKGISRKQFIIGAASGVVVPIVSALPNLSRTMAG